MVAGVYPIKRVNWDKARRMLESDRPKLPAGRARLCAGDRRSRSCRCRQRLYARALRRHRLPDGPASCHREDVRASGLCAAAVLPRALARCARRKPEPFCIVRMHDRSGRPAPISARISPSASAGPISAAKSGPISRAVSTMSGRRYFPAMSRRSLRPRQARCPQRRMRHESASAASGRPRPRSQALRCPEFFACSVIETSRREMPDRSGRIGSALPG